MEAGVARADQPESRALTGLRGIGASLVMLHHFYLHFTTAMDLPLLAGLLRKGYLGVDLFFVLSGFVIAMVYGPWFTDGWFTTPAQPRLRRMGLFLVRRLARLWPLHCVMLAATLALDIAAGGHFSPKMIVANVAMIQAWGISAEINPPAWSISTEWFAYLMFPLLALIILRTRPGVALALAAIMALLAIDMLLAPALGPIRRGQLDIYYNYSALPVLRCLAGFMLGMVAWRLGRSPGLQQALSTAWVGPAALVLMLGLMLLQANDLLIYPLLPVIVLGFHFGRGVVCRGFATGPLHWLGVQSYAVYLVHYTLLQWFPFGWGPLWLDLGCYLCTTLVLAALLHHGVERPGRHVLRRWGERLVTRSPLLPVAAAPLRRRPG